MERREREKSARSKFREERRSFFLFSNEILGKSGSVYVAGYFSEGAEE